MNVSQARCEEERTVRYVVGIDLGTTNCAVSYVDLDRLNQPGASTFPETFLIPQAVAPNTIESRETLPSFFARLYNSPTQSWDESEKRRDFSLKGRGATEPKDGKFGVVGVFARDHGAIESSSFVHSAKSWLCHHGVDRSAPILPRVDAPEENDIDEYARKRWSPTEVSSFYLRHIRMAWNDRFPDYPLEAQDVTITIPASFDETARMLTIDAAKLAGLPRVALVEEPQAAFYSWLARHEKDWTDFVRPGQKILVCDVGGGTTDFALIYALERDKDGVSEQTEARAKSVKFYRVAVGDHLVLGGDNLDLALYRYLEERIMEKRSVPLNEREQAALLKEAREAKEFFLGEKSGTTEVRRFVLPGLGAKLISGSVAIDIERSEVERVLVDGFFPQTAFDVLPTRSRGGLRQIALPYVSDPAVTKHLAHFLQTHANAGRDLIRAGVLGGTVCGGAEERGSSVDAVLFNGGAFESPKLRARIVESLTDWQGSAPTVLQNENLYLAVAHGAAYYGLALRGLGSRIGASLARSYYVGVELQASDKKNVKPKAVCLLHAQSEPGDEIALDKTFSLEVDRPVSFPIFVSSVRTTDAPGDLIEVDSNETRELAPIRTALKTRSRAKKEARTIQANLVARPTEIGTIELFLQERLAPDAGPRARASRWTLQFDARGGVQSDWEEGDSSGESEGIVDDSLIESGKNVLRAVFAEDCESLGLERVKPGDLFKRLTEALGYAKNEIPVATLRRLAETTLELRSGRKLAASVESRWLNWLGFALRPGFGVATDDWRVEQLWKNIGAIQWKTPDVRAQYWILWRRVASGLTPGRQQTLAEPLLAAVRDLRRQLVDGKGKGPSYDFGSQEGAEIWRLLGALESLPVEMKAELGDAIADVAMKKKVRPVRDALVWALGRIGARELFKAPVDRTLSGRIAERWALKLLDDLERYNLVPTGADFFALAQLTRYTAEEEFNVDDTARDRVAAFLAKHDAEDSTLAALERHSQAFAVVAQEIFGEALPLGLRWE